MAQQRAPQINKQLEREMQKTPLDATQNNVMEQELKRALERSRGQERTKERER
jgi:hypothetical protein